MDLRIAYRMFSDLWLFYKKFQGIKENDPASWRELVQEAGQIKEKYQNEFCNSLILVIVNEINKNGGKIYEHEENNS